MELSKDEFLYLIGLISFSILFIISVFISFIILSVKKRQKEEIKKLQAIISAEDSERTRIAKDLHDDLGPLLSGIKLQINLLDKNTDAVRMEEVLAETSAELDNAITNVRYVVRNLMPPGLEKYGLVKCISDFQSVISKSKNTHFEFSHSGLDKRFSPIAELNIFRIIHELINNSLKHSTGNLIKLDLNLNEEKFVIDYKDNGNALSEKKSIPGMGLSNIESRINLFNGLLMKAVDFSKGADYHIEFKSYKLFQ